MGKTKRQTFLLTKYFDKELSAQDIAFFKKDYEDLVKGNQLPIPHSNTLELMYWAKREEIAFGPYQHLTFFEISNRVYSDLVLFDAAKILFEKYHIQSIQLNMSNKGGSDMMVTLQDGTKVKGEAFNTACSFFQIKFRSEMKKFKDGQIGFMAFNKTALSEKNEKFLKRKETEYPNVKCIICEM